MKQPQTKSAQIGSDRPAGTSSPSSPPAEHYDVLVVERYEDHAGEAKSSWTRVGVAFAHKDGKGMNVELRAMPVDGKLIIRRHGTSGPSADQ